MADDVTTIVPGEWTFAKRDPKDYMIRAFEHSGAEVFCITGEGRIFWRQREVFTDEAFRSSIMELLSIMAGVPREPG